MTRVGIIGASGLAGGELVRIVDQHPHLELAFLGGSRNVGQPLVAVHPGLRSTAGTVIEAVSASEIHRRCDVVLLATPAGVSAELVPALSGGSTTVIDLSGAFRLRSDEAHHRWYPGVTRDPKLVAGFTYGVPELIADELTSADLISLPGCYATAITLALAPLVFGLELADSTVLVDGKSGSSGGGLRARRANLHPYRHGAITPYAPIGHRHAAEVQGFFAERAPGAGVSVSMSAYGVAHVRGLLASCYVSGNWPMDSRTLARAYLRYYKAHPFVRVRDHRETVIPMPDPQAVLGSNFCDITALHDPEGGRIVALAALDNLVKGAAGQAVQAVNHRFGHQPELGLTMQPVVPA
ncbi:N-acetyl-gamma-glutamyl-phosphate reductase [Amycolatopsis australiensis]|uniref:N-acetyl-gamma-glutamyl-phosphate reductase n=1 Tax=Amycolatopsis australiensis TaxID=546364 RepID=A0A1K1SRR5_9PSEU|nr:N-acetyl-gamma-glutamyl-phosphate reductase [Amycolatopsis australiensis]SFW86565.1 N-acetyl-gamma-glutamyl-phosphate reductase [Amycolatopsis australiensis]